MGEMAQGETVRELSGGPAQCPQTVSHGPPRLFGFGPFGFERGQLRIGELWDGLIEAQLTGDPEGVVHFLEVACNGAALEGQRSPMIETREDEDVD